MDEEHLKAVVKLKTLLLPFTDEACHYHNVDLARITFPLNTIPYGIAPERWRRLNHPMYKKDRYLISSWGRVFDTLNEHFPYTSLCDKGYIRVGLQRSENSVKLSQGVAVRIHRLVAHAFLPEIEGKDTVNHKDLNKTNNTLENLEWLANTENLSHGLENGSRVNLKGYNYLSKEDIIQIKELYANGVKLKHIAKQYNRKFRAISDIVNNRTYTQEFWEKMGQA